MEVDVFHPFYCTFCGETLSTKEEFDNHYRQELEEFNRQGKLSDEQIFELIYNEDNY